MAVENLNAKKLAVEQNKAMQISIVDKSSNILAEKDEITQKIDERNRLLKREVEIAGESALYTSKKKEVDVIHH